MKIREIMTADVQVVHPDESIAEVASRFAEHGIHGAPVVDGQGRLVGIVTESDIIRTTKTKYTTYNMVYPSIHQFGVEFKEGTTYSELSKAFDEVKHTPVSEIMTAAVITASPDDLVEEVAPMMIKNKINRVPVVENGKVVGIVTRGDILRGMFKADKKQK
jgi:CBS domain-containing protein